MADLEDLKVLKSKKEVKKRIGGKINWAPPKKKTARALPKSVFGDKVATYANITKSPPT